MSTRRRHALAPSDIAALLCREAQAASEEYAEVEFDCVRMRGWEQIFALRYPERKLTVILARPTTELLHCPHCSSAGIEKHGLSKPRTVVHIPLEDCAQRITFEAQRYKCRGCGKTSQQPLLGINGRRRLTCPAIEYVQRRALNGGLGQVANDTDISAKTVRKILYQHGEFLDRTVHRKTPRDLGIDDKRHADKTAFILTNLEKREVYDLILPTEEDPLEEQLKKVLDACEVERLAHDMWGGFRPIDRHVFPHAVAIADPYHVFALVEKAVDRVRVDLPVSKKRKDGKMCQPYLLRWHIDKVVRKGRWDELRQWFELYPELSAAYWVKEALYEVRYSSSIESARRKLHKWLAEIPKEVQYAFRKIAGTLRAWEAEILNHVEYRLSGAYNESANAIAKRIQRNGKRLRFKTLRYLLVYGTRQARGLQEACERRKTALPDIRSLLSPGGKQTQVFGPGSSGRKNEQQKSKPRQSIMAPEMKALIGQLRAEHGLTAGPSDQGVSTVGTGGTFWHPARQGRLFADMYQIAEESNDRSRPRRSRHELKSGIKCDGSCPRANAPTVTSGVGDARERSMMRIGHLLTARAGERRQPTQRSSTDETGPGTPHDRSTSRFGQHDVGVELLQAGSRLRPDLTVAQGSPEATRGRGHDGVGAAALPAGDRPFAHRLPHLFGTEADHVRGPR